jgi:hypothetical protein
MADLVPIRLSLSTGDRYTVWAPRWRDAGDEWEAFLGKDEDLYGFETVADLVAFVRTDSENDLVDHPAWEDLTSAHAHAFDPAGDKQFDLVAVEELVAEKPTEESVNALAAVLAIVSSIGSVCELAAVSKFFNGNPDLGTVSGGIDHFTGKAGHKRWNSIAGIIGRSWDDVLSAIEKIISTPDVDAEVSAKAADELAEEPEEPEEEAEEPTESDGEGREVSEDGEAADELEDEATEEADEDEGEARAEGDTVVLGGEEDFWQQVGIDPIRIMTDSGTFYTLLSGRPPALPGPQRPDQRFQLRTGAGPLPCRRTRPRLGRSEHLRRHPYRRHRRLTGGRHHRRQHIRAERVGRRFCRWARRRGSRPARAGRRAAPRYRRLLRGEHRRQGARNGPAAGQAGGLRAGPRLRQQALSPVFRGGTGVGAIGTVRGVAAKARVAPRAGDDNIQRERRG